jgi:hypothetical protein
MDVIDIMLIDSRQNLSSNSTLSHIGSAAQNGLNHSATAWRSMLPIYIYIWAWGSMQVSRMKNNLQQHVFLLMLFWWLCHLGSMLGPCWVIWWAIGFHGSFPKEKTTFTKSRLFVKVLFWSCLTQVEGYVRPMSGQLGSMLGPCWLDLFFIFVFYL